MDRNFTKQTKNKMEKQSILSLKKKYRIEEVVGRYVRLHPSGQYWWGLCPFHNDHHPSLAVHPGRGTFCCYACGERGDVLAFIQKIAHCSFAEAVARLTGTPSVKVASPTTGKETAGTPQKVPTTAELEAFLRQLMPAASGDSDLTPVWLDFGIGYAPHLVAPPWKQLEGRLVFPLRDEKGQLVGLASRRTDDTDTQSPKYRNSSAREGFRKSEFLYGLDRAQASIRQHREVFLVEGYKDVLAMHAAGLTQTVGLCGTALTTAHIARLQPWVSRVWLLLDHDEAGWKGSEKAARMLWEAGMEPRILSLPKPGSDPDSLFREMGREPFRAWIESVCRTESEEYRLMTRLREGMAWIQAEPAVTPRKRELWNDFRTCRQDLLRLSGQLGRLATMDWRWV